MMQWRLPGFHPRGTLDAHGRIWLDAGGYIDVDGSVVTATGERRPVELKGWTTAMRGGNWLPGSTQRTPPHL